MEGWIEAIHMSCAASFARHLDRDGTAKLLRAEIHKLENSIDLVSKNLIDRTVLLYIKYSHVEIMNLTHSS